MKTFSFSDMLGRLVRAQNQSRAAKTVEMFGWLILIEGPMFLMFPNFVASWNKGQITFDSSGC